ncbi:hypothetical protein R1flu_023032 [Riccia fluitans]|uniref:Succinate dehydrogenase subunit 3 n=1 Tax=Riccia fluitans TaxID=41844 RepID=A0ABD1XQX7_9MARC
MCSRGIGCVKLLPPRQVLLLSNVSGNLRGTGEFHREHSRVPLNRGTMAGAPLGWRGVPTPQALRLCRARERPNAQFGKRPSLKYPAGRLGSIISALGVGLLLHHSSSWHFDLVRCMMNSGGRFERQVVARVAPLWFVIFFMMFHCAGALCAFHGRLRDGFRPVPCALFSDRFTTTLHLMVPRSGVATRLLSLAHHLIIACPVAVDSTSAGFASAVLIV